MQGQLNTTRSELEMLERQFTQRVSALESVEARLREESTRRERAEAELDQLRDAAVFEPFFTTKEPGQSVGLGLATALGVVQSHGGFILIETEEDKGTEFQIYLPASGEETAERPPQAELPRGNGELLMLADDEQGVLDVTAEILEWHGYKVLKARDGQQALSLFEQHAGDIKAVITDILMPFMDGVELCRELRQRNASLPIIVASGMGHEKFVTDLRELGVPVFLKKPFAAEELLHSLHAELHKEPVNAEAPRE